MMRRVFLINGTLVFDPDKHSLRPVQGHDGRAVVIHTPASECLLKLLEHNNQVLTQKFLFEEVWEKHGSVVTTNTLYQNIASIRKGLKSAGLAEDIIKTMPKMGFKSIAVLRIGVPEDFLSESETQPEVFTNIPASMVENKKTPGRFAHFISSKWSFLFAGLLAVLCWGMLVINLIKEDSFYKNYSYIGLVNGCELYSSYPGVDTSTNSFVAMNKRYPLVCNMGSVVYMTINRLQEGSSVQLCNKKIEIRDAHCKSYFFKRGAYEQ
ncbi:winged helix-turn-helix domain-containing protein [Buttiauxella selenatireducens]|uniref:Winged helix-turn-helix domain-containing protein n=1 Tax=Buttiauxella selenatireducens TaxID=3073902 RepID=A0ABY9SCB4_9ENTR|nr:winged helix-turn-helix domain-containing protein [Buttiauxella sp. R73]WMY74588.1 winged helix-turn-helix domain-containing protein [Buttiauxella sp. R73]